MKIRISYTIDVSDEYRRAINRYYGKPGLATRDDVQRWTRTYGDSMDDDLAMDEEAAEARRQRGEDEE